MGMTKAGLELQMQQATQNAIAELQKNMLQLDQALRAIDQNARNSHMSMAGGITQLTLRLNFLLDEMKAKMSGPEIESFEARFMEFAKQENEKMQTEVAKEIERREAALEAEKTKNEIVAEK